MTSPIESAHRMSFTPSQNRSENSSTAPPLHQEWMDYIPAIEDISDKDLKTNTIPIARIKKIMKALDGVSRHMLVSSEVPLLFSKACEMLILHITGCAWNNTESNKRRTIHLEDIVNVMGEGDVFSFLSENFGSNSNTVSNSSVADTFNQYTHFPFDNSAPSNPLILHQANNFFDAGKFNDLKNHREPSQADYNGFLIFNQQPENFFLNSQASLNTLQGTHMHTNKIERPLHAMDYTQNHYPYPSPTSYTLSILGNSTSNKPLSTTSNPNSLSSVQMSNIESMNNFSPNPYNQKSTPSSHPETSNNISFTSHHPTQWTSYPTPHLTNRNTEYLTENATHTFAPQPQINNNNIRNPNYNFNNMHNGNNIPSTQGIIYPNNLPHGPFPPQFQQLMMNKAYRNQSASNQDNLRYPTPMSSPPARHPYNITNSPKNSGTSSIQSSETESIGDNYTRKSKKNSKNDLDIHFKQNSKIYPEANFQ